MFVTRGIDDLAALSNGICAQNHIAIVRIAWEDTMQVLQTRKGVNVHPQLLRFL